MSMHTLGDKVSLQIGDKTMDGVTLRDALRLSALILDWSICDQDAFCAKDCATVSIGRTFGVAGSAQTGKAKDKR